MWGLEDRYGLNMVDSVIKFRKSRLYNSQSSKLTQESFINFLSIHVSDIIIK